MELKQATRQQREALLAAADGKPPADMSVQELETNRALFQELYAAKKRQLASAAKETSKGMRRSPAFQGATATPSRRKRKPPRSSGPKSTRRKLDFAQADSLGRTPGSAGRTLQ